MAFDGFCRQNLMLILYQTIPGLTTLRGKAFENIVEQELQIVAKYARLTPSCNHPGNFIAKAIIVLEICTGQNSSMKINKGQ